MTILMMSKFRSTSTQVVDFSLMLLYFPNKIYGDQCLESQSDNSTWLDQGGLNSLVTFLPGLTSASDRFESWLFLPDVVSGDQIPEVTIQPFDRSL